MQPQTNIPTVETPEQVDAYIASRFDGVANVRLGAEMVEHLLSLNKGNRRIKDGSVTAYVQSFQKTGYACINLMHISTDGELADGQHRLLALKKLYDNGQDIGEVWQLVKFGTTDSVKMDIDNGVSRTFRDALKLNGYVTDTGVASALRVYAAMTSTSFRNKFTAIELRDIYEEDFKEVLEIGNFLCIRNIQLVGSHSYRPAPWIIAGFRICQKHFGTDKMRDVYAEYYNGDDMNLPMVRFRNWTIINRNNIRFHSDNNLGKQVLGYLFYAVKKSVNGERIQKLYSTPLGATINGKNF